MTITVPDSDDLLVEMRMTAWANSADEEYAELILQRSADLFVIATGVTDDPDDDLSVRIMESGILAMSHALWVRSKDANAVLSPFQSERLGSYSYTKMMQMVQSKGLTGIDGFDAAVAYFSGGSDSRIGVTSEDVFKRPRAAFIADVYGSPLEGDFAVDITDILGT